MVSPVSHSHSAPQPEAAASKQPKPAASTQNKTQPAQDKVTISQKSGDVNHDGDSK